MSLTTLSTVKEYLGLGLTCAREDSLLNRLMDWATDFIHSYCGRIFPQGVAFRGRHLSVGESAKKMPRLAPLVSTYGGCPNCGPKPSRLRLDSILGVGFGIVIVTRNGQDVWYGDHAFPDGGMGWKEEGRRGPYRVRHFEVKARKQWGDWRIEFGGPLTRTVYQRQGKNNWVLVEKGRGFA